MNIRLLWVLLLAAMLLPLAMPEPAYAYTFNSPPVVSGPDAEGRYEVCPGVGLTRRIIPCIKETILTAAAYFLVPFTTYIASTIATACMLALALWGTLMVTGKTTAPLRDMVILAFKIGIIYMYGSNFGIYFGLLLDAMDDMLGRVAQYAAYSSTLNCPNLGDPLVLAVWNRVDCSIEAIVGGVYSTFSLTAGVTGFFVACFFSKSVGFFIAILGFYLVVQLLFAMARALYIYISAYIAFALMIIVSPIFVTLALFSATKQYFEKWLKLTFSFILQPIILFAYLSMLLAAFDTVVYTAPNSLAHALAGNNANTPGFQLGIWLQGSGAYGETSIARTAINLDPGKVRRELGGQERLKTGLLGDVGEQAGHSAADWQNGIFEYLGVGSGGADDLRYFKLDLPLTGVNWQMLAARAGAPTITAYVVNLFLAFCMTLITIYIFWTLLDYLPYISSGLGGKPVGMPALGTGKMAAPGSKLMEGLQKKIAGRFGVSG